ncbi:MAG: hypothetical protein ACLVJ6_04200 [Merdibacter sp.]
MKIRTGGSLDMFDHLFTPIKIRGLTLANRIILPAMGTRMAGEKGEITDRLIAYHAERARGGCALNIVEVAAVHRPSSPAFCLDLRRFADRRASASDGCDPCGGAERPVSSSGRAAWRCPWIQRRRSCCHRT